MAILIIALILACLVGSVLIVHRDCRAGVVVTPFLFFVAHEVLFVWPAGIQHWVASSRLDPHPIVVILSAFVCFLIGTVAIRSVIPAAHGAAERFRAAPILCPPSVAERHYLIGVLALMLITGAVALYYYQGLPPVAQATADLVQGRGREAIGAYVATGREQLTKSHYFGGEYRGQGIVRAILRDGGAVLVGTALLLSLRYRRRHWAMLAAVAFGWSVLLVAGEGTRGPLIHFLIVLLALWTSVRLVRWRTAAIAGVIALVMFGALSLINNKVRHVPGETTLLAHTARIVLNRLAYGPGVNNVTIMQLIKERKLDYQRGAVHWEGVLAILPGVRSDDKPFAHELYLARSVGARGTTYATPTYLGKVYADFGPIGTVIIYGGIGVLLGVAQHLLLRRRRSILSLPFRALLIVTVGATSRSALTSLGPAIIVGGAMFVCLWVTTRVASSLARLPRHWAAAPG